MTLSETLRSAVDEHVDLDLSAVHRRVDHRRRRRARARVASGAMGAALLLVGIVALAAGAGDQRPDVVAEEGGLPIDDPSTTVDPTPSTSDPAPSTESTTTSEPASTPSTSTSTEPEPTTEPAPTTSTEPAPTTTAPDTGRVALGLEGTYVVDTPGPAAEASCAPGESQVGLAGTITASPTATWQRSEQGCATIGSDWVYRGEGTFVLTDPDGATLTGTFLSVAQLPTDGVPYSYVVTGGTGAYAGAEGSCDLTVRITSGTGLAGQRQEGEIDCAVTLPSPPG